MKKYKLDKQQGIALFAAVMIIIIFAIVGLMAVQKAKNSERIAGAKVRHSIVFEAAEQTILNAGRYITNIKGTPLVVKDVHNNANKKAENFNINNMDTIAIQHDSDQAIVWQRGVLLKKNSFAENINDSLWEDKGIKSVFNDIASDNYLGDVITYTFIEALSTPTNTSKFGNSSVSKSVDDNSGVKFYLITVKASGFPPGVKDKDKTAKNSRENVIIQAVLAKR